MRGSKYALRNVLYRTKKGFLEHAIARFLRQKRLTVVDPRQWIALLNSERVQAARWKHLSKWQCGPGNDPFYFLGDVVNDESRRVLIDGRVRFLGEDEYEAVRQLEAVRSGLAKATR